MAFSKNIQFLRIHVDATTLYKKESKGMMEIGFRLMVPGQAEVWETQEKGLIREVQGLVCMINLWVLISLLKTSKQTNKKIKILVLFTYINRCCQQFFAQYRGQFSNGCTEPKQGNFLPIERYITLNFL